jgi:hypothetical protein
MQQQARSLSPGTAEEGSTPTSTATESTVEFSWNVNAASSSLFRAQGVNDSLDGLEARIVAPNGTSIDEGTPDRPWFEWNRASDPGFGDTVCVAVDEPDEGRWRLELSGETDEPLVFVGSVELDSLLRLERRFEGRATVGESFPIRVAFLNGTTPQIGAQIDGEILDPTLNHTTALRLNDRGKGEDLQAGDGLHSGSYHP